MKFTVNLRNITKDNATGSYDLSYGLVFIPAPIWVQGKKQILNLNPGNPKYEKGSISRLLHAENIKEELVGSKAATVTVYPEGIGAEDDLQILILDLESEGFEVKIIHI